MSERFGAFLRGVNVNGNKIPMKALREAFQSMGFPDAKTVLNTGNVVFTADTEACPRPELKARIERALDAAFGYKAPVYLRSAGELAASCLAAAGLAAPENCHVYLLLCDSAGLPAELGALFAGVPHLPKEGFLPAASDAFWIVQKGATLTSAFGSKVLGAKKYQSRLTSRNISTVAKMARMME